MFARSARLLHPRWRQSGFLCGYLILIASCPTEQQYIPGEFVAYNHEKSLQLCAGTANYVDVFALWTATALGIELKQEIQYHWLTPEAFSEVDCPDKTAGCQISDRVYSRYPALLHEVVHAITEQNGMNSSPFFTEGVAVAFDPWPGSSAGPRYKFAPPPGEPQGDPRPYMTQPAAEVYYDLAGAFVSFLLLRHGPEKFTAFVRRLKAGADYTSISSTFFEAYGIELDDEAVLFMSNEPCDEAWSSLLAYDCTANVIPWDNSVWSWDATMSCAEPEVVGGIGPEANLGHRSVTLDIPVSGLYEVYPSTSEADVRVTLGRCFGCPWYPRDMVIEGNERQFVELSAGKYFMRITADSRIESEVNISLLPR